MYGYGGYTTGTYGGSSMSGGAAAGVWTIIALVIAVIGGICLYFTVFSKKNEGKYKGFMAWLYDFVKFKKMCAATILKITYMISAIFITLWSFAFITQVLLFFGMLILGNLFLRVAYEFSLVLLSIHENVVELNEKTKK